MYMDNNQTKVQSNQSNQIKDQLLQKMGYWIFCCLLFIPPWLAHRGVAVLLEAAHLGYLAVDSEVENQETEEGE